MTFVIIPDYSGSYPHQYFATAPIELRVFLAESRLPVFARIPMGHCAEAVLNRVGRQPFKRATGYCLGDRVASETVGPVPVDRPLKGAGESLYLSA